jgi:hypothetical protein
VAGFESQEAGMANKPEIRDEANEEVSMAATYVVIKVRLKKEPKGLGPQEWNVDQQQFESVAASLPYLESYPARLYVRKAEKHFEDGSILEVILD